MAGIGPGPFAAMLLADLGADVVRVERYGGGPWGDPDLDVLGRGRPSVGVDVKNPEGVALVLDLVGTADVLIEGFRPGVMERMGLGPDVCRERNPRLVFGRMTGWGQDGPFSQMAGHDINYISISGALHSFTRAGDKPVPPINLVGDFGGGAMFLVAGVLAALVSAGRTGVGQVVDAAMTDGSALLLTMMYGFMAQGIWVDEPGTNLLDTGAHFYEVYRCADEKFVSVGAIEPKFYAELIDKMGLAGEELPHQMDKTQWPAMKQRFAAVFASKTRDEWADIFAGSDACATPVLSMTEAPQHPHNVARAGHFRQAGKATAPAPAPRFSATPEAPGAAPQPASAELSHATLERWGIDPGRVASLLRDKVVS